MHYATALVVIEHRSKAAQKVRITQPTKKEDPQHPRIAEHVAFVLAIQGDSKLTPWFIAELTTKEI